jgi:glutathione synthase/RimK-type ligase-like ATP-grasp enzyme
MNSSVVSQLSLSNDAGETFNGLAALMTLAFRGVDLGPLGRTLLERAETMPGPSSANALMDVATILHIKGNHEVASRMQQCALELKQLYQLPAKEQPTIRILAFYAPGDLNSNTPLEFLVENSDIELNILYLADDLPSFDGLPPHDVLFVAVGESERNRVLLRRLESTIPAWPRPILNRPDRIARLARDTASQLLHSVPGLVMPIAVRGSRTILNDVARRKQRISAIHETLHFPLIIRPVDAHAGMGLIKTKGPESLRDYLQKMPQSEFYVSRFIDYRSRDGLFRKYRVVLIDGHPYAAHMAISREWMVHYLNAGMTESAEKRAEEASFMEHFDEEFASRHRAPLQSIVERTGLDYLVVDCAETRDGKLLVFEVDSSAVVHAMDPAETFPYKQKQIQKVFAAFRSMLVKAMS